MMNSGFFFPHNKSSWYIECATLFKESDVWQYISIQCIICLRYLKIFYFLCFFFVELEDCVKLMDL